MQHLHLSDLQNSFILLVDYSLVEHCVFFNFYFSCCYFSSNSDVLSADSNVSDFFVAVLIGHITRSSSYHCYLFVCLSHLGIEKPRLV